MSHSQELTSLRSSGYSLGQILAPILFASALLFCFTFWITSEVATTAHLKTRRMVHDFGSVNPLILLQNARIAKLKGAFVAMEPLKSGESAKNLVVAARIKDKLALYTAKELKLKNDQLSAEKVTLIFHPEEKLVIENQSHMHTRASDFAFMLRPKGWKIANDHLNFSLLRARQTHLKQIGGPKMKKNLLKNRSEAVRRFSVSFATCTFTLMGAALGMEISRRKSKRGVLTAAFLSALALICFFVAHELDHLFWASTLLLTLPHLMIISSIVFALSRLQRGIE